MAASQSTGASSVPQGFSVYQPNLGAQLQFLPAVGTKELDDMINSFIPGPASTQEKRTAISIDFLEYASTTGQTFKFYPVYTVSTSPATQSPVTDSVSSSFNASPVASSWDFSRVSSQSSNARQSHKSSPSSRTTDFSHIPGMKIMTKEGVDVTNQASRGSKTKEQRDHAHLMRIIKACDACKRKKVRCDPSHKKRSVAASAPTQTGTSSSSRVAKKAKVSDNRPSPAVAPVVATNADNLLSTPSLSFDFDTSFSFDPTTATLESWEDLLQFPADQEIDEDYNFFEDPRGYFSPIESSLSSLGTASTNSPVVRDDENGTSAVNGRSPSPALPVQDATSSEKTLPYADHTTYLGDYVDFNLFSPESDFSEDEHMVALKPSSGSLSCGGEDQSTGSNSDLLQTWQSSFGSMRPQAHGQSELYAPHDSPESSWSGGIAAQVSSAYYADGDHHSHDPGRGLNAPSPASSVVSSSSSLPSLSTATSSESSASGSSLEMDKVSASDSQMTDSSVSRYKAHAVETITTLSNSTETRDVKVQRVQRAPDELIDAALGPDMITRVAIMNAMAIIAASVCQTALHLTATHESDRYHVKRSQAMLHAQSRSVVACV